MKKNTKNKKLNKKIMNHLKKRTLQTKKVILLKNN